MGTIAKALVAGLSAESCEQVRQALEGLGIEVHFSGCGEAPGRVASLSPDFMIMAVYEHAGEGIETLRAIRSVGQAVPVIVVSGIKNDAFVTTMYTMGVCDFIGVPIDMYSLIKSIEMAIHAAAGVALDAEIEPIISNAVEDEAGNNTILEVAIKRFTARYLKHISGKS